MSEQVNTALLELEELGKLESALDARGSWDAWRTNVGVWAIQLSHLPEKPTFGDRSLLAAMRMALAYQPVPVYPRRPAILSDAEPVKRDGKWVIWEHYHFKTKTEAVAFRDDHIARRSAEIEDWVDKVFPQVDGRTEGVDFQWSRRGSLQ